MTLSQIEKQALKALDGEGKSFEEIAEKAGIPVDSVRRAASWLKDKGLAVIEEKEEEKFLETEKGKNALEKGLPEKVLVETLKKLSGKAEIKKTEEETGLGKEFNYAFGEAKKFNAVTVKQGVIELTGLEEEFLQTVKEKEENLKKKSGKYLEELVRRGLLEKRKGFERKAKISEKGLKERENLKEGKEEINVLSHAILESGEWKGKSFRKYNLKEPVPETFAGKKQPYIQFLEGIRKKLVGLGFQEMPSPLIVTEFYNFDVLFQPQNHPARTWSDTYQLKNPKLGVLPSQKIVKKIRQAHEFGGKTKSKGWNYSWKEEIAKKVMPSAHGTAHSARKLVEGIEVPGKYFAVAGCFRPDVLDATHLIEFNQMEGFIADESFNFKHLLGMLKQFAVEIAGAEKVKFYPDYYPFTEPSVQLSAKHPELGWIEFGGAGIFRPEMTESLGIKAKCLAWGLGIDRLAMFKLGIKDIRELFSQDLEWLRKQKMVKE